MKSIMQKSKRCWVCGAIHDLHNHHIYFGNGIRKISEKQGFKVWLCAAHHNMSDAGVHYNKKLDTTLKQMCQLASYEKTHSREEFVRLIGRNYLGGESQWKQ